MASSSPRKPKLPVQQLIILSICRFAEPLALTSVFPYLPEMIESFNVPEKDIAQWAGITSAVFSFSQCLTGIAWGRGSDYLGRKFTILVGLSCTMLASLLFGFSRSLTWAIVSRSLGGASSGTVGIIRTMVAEMVPERELQPRAFSVMPLVWSIGAIAGPILGGTLANPAKHLPDLFGGIGFFETFPFALPNLVASLFFVIGLTFGFLFLKETLEHRKNDRDYGRILGQALVDCFRFRSLKRTRCKEYDELGSPVSEAGPRILISPPSYREVFSYQSSLNLFAYTLLALHSIAYDQLIAVFLHITYEGHLNYSAGSPLKFAGGFGLSTARIGLLLTLYGIAGMFLQFLVFPPLARRYGVLNCLRVVSLIYPVIYMATPFAVLLPSTASRQIAIFCIMLFKCLAGVFSFPCTTILLTNSAGSLRLLGTLNGLATSISAAGRGIGPFTMGNLFTWGQKIGYVVIPWWALAFCAVLGHIPTWWLVETEGFGNQDAEAEESDEEDHEGVSSGERLLIRGSSTTSPDQKTGNLARSQHKHLDEEALDSDDDDAEPDKPLLSNKRASREPSTTREEVSAPPLGMDPITRTDSRLSSNLGLSEGLGRTDIGSGFGTHGPDLGMGYDRSLSRSVSRSRSTSKRRHASRSRSRNPPTGAKLTAVEDNIEH